MGHFNDFGLFWINTAETLGISSRWVWEGMGAASTHQSSPAWSRKWDLGQSWFPAAPCWGWMPRLAVPGCSWQRHREELGTAAAARDTLCSSRTGNSVGTALPALGWVRFARGSAQIPPSPIPVFAQSARSVCASQNWAKSFRADGFCYKSSPKLCCRVRSL